MGKEINSVLRDNILLAALDELESHGPEFHMDDLARRLHISKRTIYEYFPSKYDVIEQTLVKLAIGVLKRHEELVANESMTFEEKLNAYFSTNPVTNKVFSMRKAKQIFTIVPKICDVLESYAVQDWKLLEQIFRQAHSSEEFIDFDTSLLMHMLRSASEGVLDYVEKTDCDYSYPEYMQRCIRIIVCGIKKDRRSVLHDTKK